MVDRARSQNDMSRRCTLDAHRAGAVRPWFCELMSKQGAVGCCLHDAMHLIIDNVSRRPEIDGVDDLVVAVIFVTVQILSLSTMSYVLR
jgi:hypothetical protein